MSIIGTNISGFQVVKDETSGNVAGKNSLPKTGIDPVTGYHVEYTLVFVLIFEFGMLVSIFGKAGKKLSTSIKRLSERTYKFIRFVCKYHDLLYQPKLLLLCLSVILISNSFKLLI